MSFLIISIICSSMMFPGFVSYGILSLLEKKKENFAVFLFTAVMLSVGISRTAALLIAYLRPDLAAAYRWNLAYEASLLFFFPLIPFFLSSILNLGPTGRKINSSLYRAGWLLILVFLSVIFIEPGAYIRPFPLDDLPHPVMMGRGSYRPASYVSMGMLFVYAVYTLAMTFSQRKKHAGQAHMKMITIGIIVTILMLLGEFYKVYAGRYPDPFPPNSVPRTLVALTVFTLTAIVSITQKSAAEARETARESTEVKERRNELAMVAYFDDMTGYPNRSALFRNLRETCIPPAHMALIDIDNLAYVNSYHGYSVGDDLIRAVGKVCEKIKSPEAGLYRVDADAFVLLDRTDVRSMEATAAGILREVRKLAVPGAEDMPFTVSIGIAGAESGITQETWANRVNTALVRAKAGRDRFVTFDPDLHDNESRRQEIITGMRRSLDESGFRLYYQPIVTHGMKTVGAEALVRWDHPRLGPIAPEEFIPLAEATGLITRLTRFVIEEAAADFSDEAAEMLGMRVNINLSGRDVTDRNLLGTLKDIAEGRRSGSPFFGFEVTETDLIADTAQSIRNLSALRDAGYTVALDDFGTGYSSLSYLNDLPLDRLKIDRSFIADLPDNKRRAVLLEAIIQLGRKLNLDLILEGVENARQFAFLRNLDCRYFQGFHFAPPMNIGDFREWMGRESGATA